MEDAARIRELEGVVAALSAKIKDLENDNARLSALVYKVEGREPRKANAGISNHQIKQRLVALKIMYFGSRYHGFASQGCAFSTVESELFAALEKTKLVPGSVADAKYSRCGRTDRGVSATAQVVALYLRSKRGDVHEDGILDDVEDRVAAAKASRQNEEKYAAAADDEEIDYISALNRALPRDIRVLGWCPVPPGFSARFNCIFREYKYFFVDDGLNIVDMKEAAQKLVGQHDFRNFCKMDAENIHNYVREIYAFDIAPLSEECWAGRHLWVMHIRGNAFLWHQVRCMAAVLFMIGYGNELPTVIDDLLDIDKISRKPQYLMASELPLVLQNCAFQGLSFRCRPEARRQVQQHLQKILDETLLSAAIIHEGIWSGSEQTPPVLSSQRPRVHVPLFSRPTEPSYEERRKTDQ